MADTIKWPLPLDRVQAIVEHLVSDGTREGLILGDELNTTMGASARRRAEREQPTQMKCPQRPEGDNSTHHMIAIGSGNMICRYCGQTRAQILKED